MLGHKGYFVHRRDTSVSPLCPLKARSFEDTPVFSPLDQQDIDIADVPIVFKCLEYALVVVLPRLAGDDMHVTRWIAPVSYANGLHSITPDSILPLEY